MRTANALYYNQVYRSPGFAVGWGTLAMINGSIAESKSRSPVFWSALSLLGGPAVTFYLVYIAKSPLPITVTPYTK